MPLGHWRKSAIAIDLICLNWNDCRAGWASTSCLILLQCRIKEILFSHQNQDVYCVHLVWNKLLERKFHNNPEASCQSQLVLYDSMCSIQIHFQHNKKCRTVKLQNVFIRRFVLKSALEITNLYSPILHSNTTHTHWCWLLISSCAMELSQLCYCNNEHLLLHTV